ncbi:MAG: hypothetical protein QOD13_3289, partial [Thermoleophilaceae bacterium]|nr:hypothetical protein [Thermoleophilaceae bacterium]
MRDGVRPAPPRQHVSPLRRRR